MRRVLGNSSEVEVEPLRGHLASSNSSNRGDIQRNYESISKEDGDLSIEEDVEEEEEEEEEDEMDGMTDQTSLMEQFQIISRNSFPTILSLLMTLFSMTVTMFFAGILSSRTQNNAIFGGISLAATFADISFFSFIEGFLSATETLCSQQNGAKQYTEVGKTAGFSLVVLSLICIPLIYSWNYVAYFFSLMGVDPAVCEVTHNYLMIEIFATPGYLMSYVYGTYLQSMGIMSPSMYGSIFYNILLIICSYVAICIYNHSYQSLALIHVVCTYFDLAFVAIITFPMKEVSRSLSTQSFKDFNTFQISSFLLLGFSGCLTTCSEWWTMEILILIASTVSTSALSSITILLDLLVLLLMIPMGIEITISSLIGNSIGAGFPRLARSIGSLSYLLILLVDIVLSPLVYFFGIYYIKLFASDPLVIFMTESCLIFLSIQIFIDGFLSISYGILNALGKQRLCTCVTVLTYIVIIIPLGWYLCISNELGVVGLLLGLMIGSAQEVLVIGATVIYFCYISPLNATFVREDEDEEEIRGWEFA